MAVPTRGTSIDRLVEYLFDGAPSESLAEEVHGWLAAAPRFRAFAEAHRDKIRKKLRGAAGPESRRDLRAELRVAHALLGDRRFHLEFEAYGSAHPGPDFTVSFRAAVAFNLEVTRLQHVLGDSSIAGALLTKLRQLPRGAANAVLLAMPPPGATADQIGMAVPALRQRADSHDEALFRAARLDRSGAFYDRLLRLSSVIAWWEAGEAGNAGVAAWTNPAARIAVRRQALQAALHRLAAG